MAFSRAISSALLKSHEDEIRRLTEELAAERQKTNVLNGRLARKQDELRVAEHMRVTAEQGEQIEKRLKVIFTQTGHPVQVHAFDEKCSMTLMLSWYAITTSQNADFLRLHWGDHCWAHYGHVVGEKMLRGSLNGLRMAAYIAFEVRKTPLPPKHALESPPWPQNDSPESTQPVKRWW